MTETVDLRKKDRENPPEVDELIKKYRGYVGLAEAAAQVDRGYFSKVRRGRVQYTDFMKQKILRALEGPLKDRIKMISEPKKANIPDTCPPILADLIRFKGTKAACIKALGTSEGRFYAVANGSAPLPDAWVIRAKAAMGQSVIGTQIEPPPLAAPAPEGTPEFVPWDGKSKGKIELQGNGKNMGRIIKNVPQPIVDVVLKYGGLTGAAKMIGAAIGTVTSLAERKVPFTDKYQRKFHAAFHGLKPPSGPSMGQEYDLYTMGIAICMIKSANFDRIAEIADILMAKIVFRKNTKSGWLVIYRMADEDLPKFKKLALRDAEEIVCP